MPFTITKEIVNSASFLDETFIGSYFGTISDWSNETYTQEIANGYFKPKSEKQTVTFNLRMIFRNLSRSQDYNKGETFNGNIVINSPEAKVYGQIANYLAKLDKNENNLKIDDTADSNLRYTGSNPNNFVSFNNKLWRIVGNFNVYNAETNQYETLTKIVSNDSIGSYSWDENNIGSWNQASLMKFLNKEYINTINESSKMIAKVRWNLGEIYNGDPISLLNLYNAERGTNHVINPTDGVERKDYWDGKVGLIYPSDLAYASIDTTCRLNFNNCVVSNSNWLDFATWTISPNVNDQYGVIERQGTISSYNALDVYPVIYLKSNVTITGGIGTSLKPYLIDGDTYDS